MTSAILLVVTLSGCTHSHYIGFDKQKPTSQYAEISIRGIDVLEVNGEKFRGYKIFVHDTYKIYLKPGKSELKVQMRGSYRYAKYSELVSGYFSAGKKYRLEANIVGGKVGYDFYSAD